MARLELVPITRDEAKAFVARHHRTHPKRPPGWKFGVGVALDDAVVGVAMVGNPKARMLNDGWTLEVNRVCVLELPPIEGRDGKQHAAGAVAMLYAACWRATRALGFRRLVTYTLPSEGGASLRGAGWTLVGEAGGGSWSRRERPRVDQHPTQRKLRWERAG
jgi:hypothetical protein